MNWIKKCSQCLKCIHFSTNRLTVVQWRRSHSTCLLSIFHNSALVIFRLLFSFSNFHWFLCIFMSGGINSLLKSIWLNKRSDNGANAKDDFSKINLIKRKNFSVFPNADSWTGHFSPPHIDAQSAKKHPTTDIVLVSPRFFFLNNFFWTNYTHFSRDNRSYKQIHTDAFPLRFCFTLIASDSYRLNSNRNLIGSI